MTDEEIFEEWWIEFENTDGIVDFCNDQLKYVAEKAFHADNLDGKSKKINSVLVSNNPNMCKHVQEGIEMNKDIIRVLRVIEYVGEREAVEACIAKSIHGVLKINGSGGKYEIRAATIGIFPEILNTLKEENNE